MTDTQTEQAFEMTVTVTITGYEKLTAVSKEAAVEQMTKILDREFSFKAPLSNKVLEYKIRAAKPRP